MSQSCKIILILGFNFLDIIGIIQIKECMTPSIKFMFKGCKKTDIYYNMRSSKKNHDEMMAEKTRFIVLYRDLVVNIR